MAELAKITSAVFYELLVLGRVQQVYAQADSTYRKLQQLAQLRLKSGESNMLEKANADNQLLQLSTKSKQLKTRQNLLQQQLSFLLNTPSVFLPEADELKAKLLFNDTLSLATHPIIKLQEQEEKVALASTKVEQAKLLPEFNLGYNSTTLRDGIQFSGDDRFQSFQVGVHIPLFGGAQRNRVKSAKNYQEYRKAETENTTQHLANLLKSTYGQYEEQSSIVEELASKGLKTAIEITGTLNSQLQNGEINYLEWTLLNNETIAIKERYFEAVKELNNTIITLNYLLGK
jgi:cobalt-zinc-cadmium resistance protein CzcA